MILTLRPCWKLHSERARCVTEVASSSYSPRTKMGEDHWTDTNHTGSLLVAMGHAWSQCAKKALEQLNGFELAGRPMKVGHVTERSDSSTASSFLDNDELERTGIDLGTTGRLQLMARLAEGSLSFNNIQVY
ncbi:hypothetical protein XENOCAPTIV_012589 [Xenoophorus captivus]|uniref:Splicing factor RBM39 linker domain-containing protein n=1 Tax=Xenoophorus captivus TaxID=1517983 RepID=A0ABV0R4Z6_9TELE